MIIAIAVLVTLWLRHFQKNEEQDIPAPDPVLTELPWYKQAVIYTLDVEVFQDSDSNGIGDFNGLRSRLGYLDSMGVQVIWLAPFQPTPGLDDGYDITDYYGVDPRLGTMQDFELFMQDAAQRNLRVIMDLVANHTSDQHPWFRQAEKDTTSPYHSWYVWSNKRPQNWNTGMVFPGVQHDIWTFDSTAKAWYYHRFYRFQPDLNLQHPPVFEEIKKIVKFWMDKKVSGFRLDGVPFFIEVPALKGDKFEHQFDKLESLHSFMSSLNKDAIILGEANVLPEETKDFFGEQGRGMQMMFNFYVNQHLFYALATGNTSPLKDALQQTKEIPAASQWGQFLRNHDEVDLGRLSTSERNKVYEQFGPQKKMQLYDRGIRRRLAPMLGNNRKQIELAYSILFALPSTPVIRYGDEIGMGDDLSLRERLSVRTPMQWNDQKFAGFSKGVLPVRPVIDTGVFSFHRVNVADQQADSLSLLNWTRKMILLRTQHPEIGYGSWEILASDNDQVLVLAYTWHNRRLFTLHNFSAKPVTVRLRPPENLAALTDILSGNRVLLNRNRTADVTLAPYGYQWLFTLIK
ncbi:MAG: alpha-amylase family protein [Pseudobacter sp.]|uniref:alpha-amylase family protein n=1 Tax=Pseudobacter sp. TaxID=2045420 RepID=UPI003F7DC26C